MATNQASKRVRALEEKAHAQIARVADKVVEAEQELRRTSTVKRNRVREMAQKLVHYSEELATRAVHSARETKQKATHSAERVSAVAEHRRQELTDKLLRR